MGQFSADLFLRLAKDADSSRQIPSNGDYDIKDTSIRNGSFTKEGLEDISKFKDAVFMIMMLRARRYMQVNSPKDENSFPEHAFTNFGITLIDSDVHPKGKAPKGLANATGGIGLTVDSYYLDGTDITDIANKLFAKNDGRPPLVNLACTLT